MSQKLRLIIALFVGVVVFYFTTSIFKGESNQSKDVAPSSARQPVVQTQPSNTTQKNNGLPQSSPGNTSTKSVDGDNIDIKKLRFSNIHVKGYEKERGIITISLMVECISNTSESVRPTRDFALRKPGQNTILPIAGYHNSGNGPNETYMFDLYPRDKTNIVVMFKIPDEINGYIFHYIDFYGKMYPLAE